jgi:alcohol dehydrogenase
MVGPGIRTQLPSLIAQYGQRVLLITGAKAFVNTPAWQALTQSLTNQALHWSHETIAGEPSPQQIDDMVAQYRNQAIDVVVGIGGGSPMDAAKAVAGLLLTEHSIMDFLEGVGRGLTYTGPALPLIAVPTTAGTGSEATRNAVITQPGAEGFKKSFRDPQLMPKVALVDAELLNSCPPAQLAANTMDAFTQLLESYTSSKASPFTDALAWSGLVAWQQGLWPAWRSLGSAEPEGLGHLAYASLMSGVTLAQAGLGAVHGLASPLGAFFPIPHGVVCGTLVATTTATNIRALRSRDPEHPALNRYAEVGRLLSQNNSLSTEEAQVALVDTLTTWVETLGIGLLSEYGIGLGDCAKVVANARGGSMQTNPIELTDVELTEILASRIG